MNGNEVLRQELQNRLTKMQVKNPRFSLRAFAKQLGLQSGTLSLVLLGKRKISTRLGKKISNALGFDPAKEAKLLASLKSDSPQKIRNLKTLQLASDQFLLLKDWRHFAVLSLMNTVGFKPNEKWISKRLNIGIKEAKETWKRLLRLELVSEDSKGVHRPCFDRIKTEDDRLSLALQHSHIEGLRQAEEAISTPLSDREYNWVVFAVQKQDMPKLKNKIRKFREEVIEEFGMQKNADEVYRMNVQLFPYSKPIQEKTK